MNKDNTYSDNERSIRVIAIQTENSHMFYIWILLNPLEIVVNRHVCDVTFWSIWRVVQIFEIL